ncbi:hypothetical protein [Roseovarius aestuariivivens]|uniref:hypothetical protein n=1 Tax=Roseovarius aestuariivivens TaxID=1888910 RepID=UPI001080B893|nr:hypothetical protein [Roseovarius aestuariivivens]
MQNLVSLQQMFLASLATVLATAASGNDAIEDTLGGPVTTCTGAIAWTDNDDKRVEPMRFAVRDAEDSAEIALFLNAADFVPDDVWTCQDGLCASSAVTSGGATMNVVQLHHHLDLPDGEVIYRMDAVFMIVGAGESPMQTQGANGQGAFFCERPLPPGLVVAARQ